MSAQFGRFQEWSGPGEFAFPRVGPPLPVTGLCGWPNEPGAILGVGMSRFAPAMQLVTLRGEDGEWTKLGPPGPVWFDHWASKLRLALDESRQRAVALVPVGDGTNVVTREFDGTSWTEPAGVTQPSLGAFAYLYYNIARQRVELIDNTGRILSWDGSSWTQRRSGLSGRVVTAACYDRDRAVLVSAGTWYGSRAVFETDSSYGISSLWFATGSWPETVQSLVYDEGRRRCIGNLGHQDAFSYDPVSHGWINVSRNPARPELRSDACLAQNESLGTVMFGGRRNGAVVNETWLYNGQQWVHLAPATAPSPRQAAAMSGNPDRVVLFGGDNNNGQYFNDTWIHTAAGWQSLPTIFPPQPRSFPAMAADPLGSGSPVYLHGGANATSWFADLRRLDWVPFLGNYYWQWTNVQTASGPGPRAFHAMAVDSTRRKLVLFGGCDQSLQPRNDTWEFDLSGTPNWTQRFPAHNPPGRTRHGMAYDRKRQRTMLYGGLAGPSPFSDVWEWDGSDWAQRTYANMAPEFGDAIASHDPVRDRMITVSNGDTFELLENIGPAAPYQTAPLSLKVTRAPIVSGGIATPLDVEFSSSGGFSLLYMAEGPRPFPYAIGQQWFCSNQPLFVPGYATQYSFDNPARYSIAVPPAAAGLLFTLQGLAFGNGCYDTTDAITVRVQSL